jgi:Holliday junction DNA helicase RuvB
MEDRSVYIATADKKSMKLGLHDFTLVAATTDEFAILPPLRDRFQLILPFTWYEPDVLAKIVAQHAAGRQIHLDDGVDIEIACRSRGTPRLALRLLEACHRLTRSEGANTITTGHFEKTVELEGVDDLGLGPDEQKYLQYLASKPGQAVRLFTLASALGLHTRTVQEVIEPFLLRVGLIERTEKGRLITPAGLEHLAKQAEAVPTPSG